MTVEIRELVIHAKVSVPDHDGISRQRTEYGLETVRDERWIQTVVRRVLEQLRDEGWGPR
ncbi:DUF5908 family protein [Paraburkholderia xenovorans]|uniref:DUF5908 family protein n=1 Tax=Paraburkholderia xenovorans TaxID=36873 RepID=UPI0038B9C3F6